MDNDKHLKISFCTTCKGRLEHLKETLPRNLKNNADYPNTEFVILDYGSDDGLADWVKQNYQREIDSGKIRYARFEAPYFKMAHAKNMAHRLATGDVVCNLDADNITAPGFAAWLNKQFSEAPDSVVRADKTLTRKFALGLKEKMPVFSKVHSVQGVRLDKGLEGVKLETGLAGIGGRVAITRENFMRLRGYDESYKGWGGEDDNLLTRAKDNGLQLVLVPEEKQGVVLSHDDHTRTTNMSPDELPVARVNLERANDFHTQPLHRKTLRKMSELLRPSEAPSAANPDGHFGCGTVHINFDDSPYEIEPMMRTYSLAPETLHGPTVPQSKGRH